MSDTPAPSHARTTPQFGAWLCVALAALAALACGPTRAAGFTVGAGGGASRGKVDCLAAFPCDRSDTGLKIYAGYQLTPDIDARLSYIDGNRFKGADVSPLGTPFGGTFKVSGLALTGGYLWRFAPAWSLQGRLGVASVRARFVYAAPFSGSAGKTTTQPTGGLSLGYDVTPGVRVGVDVDVTRFEAHETHGSLQTFGLFAQYAF